MAQLIIAYGVAFLILSFGTMLLGIPAFLLIIGGSAERPRIQKNIACCVGTASGSIAGIALIYWLGELAGVNAAYSMLVLPISFSVSGCLRRLSYQRNALGELLLSQNTENRLEQSRADLSEIADQLGRTKAETCGFIFGVILALILLPSMPIY